jgi:hypothetical protein
LQLKIINQIPDISPETIEDRNKFDMLARSLTLVQILWLVFSLRVRLKRALDIYKLEVLTAASVACSTVTYFCCWNKPVDVSITIYAQVNPEYVESMGLESRRRLGRGQKDKMVQHLTDVCRKMEEASKRIPNDSHVISVRTV